MKLDIALVRCFVEDTLHSGLGFIVTHANMGPELLHAVQIKDQHRIVIKFLNELWLSDLLDLLDVKGLVNRIFLYQLTNVPVYPHAVPTVIAGKE